MSEYNKKLRESYLSGRIAEERVKMQEQNIYSFDKLAGVDAQKKEILESLKMPLEFSKFYEYVGVEAVVGLIVQGPCGCGKTAFAYAAAKEAKLPIFPITRNDFIGKGTPPEDNAEAILAKAQSHAPSILLIDDIDRFCMKRESLDNESDKRVVLRVVEFISNLPKQIVVIATATSVDDVDPILRRSGRLEKEIKLMVPTEGERTQIIKKLFSFTVNEGLDYQEITKLTPGYVGADIKLLVTEAGHSAVRRFVENRTKSLKFAENKETFSSGPVITQDDVAAALGRVQPVAKKEGFTTASNISLDDVGAMHHIKKVLEMAIIQPSLYPERFLKVGIQRPAGVLLYGPPGTGKTMLARAVSNKTHCNFISVKGPELISMYYGESERAIRKLFARAKASQPCVIFFDEIDSICRRRDAGANKFGDTLVNQLLIEMDGLEGRGAVYVLGATNRIDIIDRALLRPGRFDNIIEVLPPTPEELVEILSKKLSKLAVDCAINLNELYLEGLTGAEIDLLIREAGNICLQTTPIADDPVITQMHLESALEKLREKQHAIQK
ncbi:ribosome biogenesis ATPase [Nematocida minor]|uniref:ribosome biogenesis ATPase n=1 Tax=Nematocida minor TaxID=1912983 RepID=UPI00221F76EF|nr:ribosome biogenesis ATPase [Nematocida minor]KAI5190098.1 ribosome biogenesis ATPase [Nematocida minor]